MEAVPHMQLLDIPPVIIPGCRVALLSQYARAIRCTTFRQNVQLQNKQGKLQEAKVLLEQWRREYNQVRPHSTRGYRPPAPEAILSMVMT